MLPRRASGVRGPIPAPTGPMRRPGPRPAWPSYRQSRRQTGAAGVGRFGNPSSWWPGAQSLAAGGGLAGAGSRSAGLEPDRSRRPTRQKRGLAGFRPGKNEAFAALDPAKPRHGRARRRQKGRRHTARGRPGPPESRSPPTRRAGSQRRDPSPTRTVGPTQTGASAASNLNLLAGNDSPAKVGNCAFKFQGHPAAARGLRFRAGPPVRGLSYRWVSRNPMPASRDVSAVPRPLG